MNMQLSTNDVDQKNRLEYWHSVCREHIGSFELEDYDDQVFSSQITLSNVGSIGIGQFTGVSQTLHRKKHCIKSGDVDDYVVLLESDNLFNADHCGRQRSGRGGIVLIDISQPYYTSHPEGLDVIDFFIPREELSRALGSIRYAPGMCIESNQASFPLISTFLRSLTTNASSLDQASASRMSSIAVELIAAGFAEKIEQSPSRLMSSAAILCRAQAFLAKNIGALGLSMRDVAAALSISVRHLHQVATDEGVSLTDWLWERRLLRARDILADPATKTRSIGEIAYNCGFRDQAHFSRAFKGRFGQTPSEVRVADVVDRKSESI